MRALLNLIQIEFLKLRRKKFVAGMLFAALIMPVIAVFYFGMLDTKELDPIKFYKWATLSYTPWILLPVVLGVLSTLLMYDEHQNDMLKQLWVVPIGKLAYFFSKFFVMLMYSNVFMMISAIGSILAGLLSGLIPLTAPSLLFLFGKCLEISLLAPAAMLPVLALAAAQRNYLLPVGFTIIYTFFGFILLMTNMYLHPLSAMTAILVRNDPVVILNEPINTGKAFLVLGIWSLISTIGAGFALRRSL